MASSARSPSNLTNSLRRAGVSISARGSSSIRNRCHRLARSDEIGGCDVSTRANRAVLRHGPQARALRISEDAVDARQGLTRSLKLSGEVWGSGQHHAPEGGAFQRKKVAVEISTPVPDMSRFGDLPTKVGVGNNEPICGWLGLRAGVAGEPIVASEDGAELEPILIQIHVDSESFEAMHGHARRAAAEFRVLHAKAEFFGRALPPVEPEYTHWGVNVVDLDVTEKQTYALRSFQLEDTFRVDPTRDRVLPHRSDHDFTVVVELSSARYECGSTTGRPGEVSALGRVTRGSGIAIDLEGTEVQINFLEFEPDETGLLPRENYLGHFEFWSKAGDDASAEFAFVPVGSSGDLRSMIVPVLAAPDGSRVLLRIVLDCEPAKILRAHGKEDGDVLHYSFDVRRLFKQAWGML